MHLVDIINSRRSIRRFAPTPIAREMVDLMLQAAMNAPSAGNQQPWSFVVIDDRSILNRIAEVHPYAAMASQATLAILVCGEQRLEKHPGFWVQDCSAATQNLLLAAHSLGLGAVWVGIHPLESRIEGIRSIVRIPEGVSPFSLIPVGHPAEEVPPENRFNQSRVHWNNW